jgi:hypothetical protein
MEGENVGCVREDWTTGVFEGEIEGMREKL